MDEERKKEIEKFVLEFNEKLDESKRIFKEKKEINKRNRERPKSMKIMNRKFEKELFKVDSNSLKNSYNNILFKKNKPWQPTNIYPHLFSDLIKNDNSLNKININENQIKKCKTKNSFNINNEFNYWKIIGGYFDSYPNRKKNIGEVTNNLTKKGKLIIRKFIENNEKKEKKYKNKEKMIIDYMHNKPKLILNTWKYSHHIIEEFEKFKVNKINSFRIKQEPKYTLTNGPFRRPKELGDYFDKNIGYIN